MACDRIFRRRPRRPTLPWPPASTGSPSTARLALQRRHAVGIDPHHQVVDVVVDLREPAPGAGRNNHDVSASPALIMPPRISEPLLPGPLHADGAVFSRYRCMEFARADKPRP